MLPREEGQETPWHNREGTREILQSTVSKHLDHSTVKAIRESATTLKACNDGIWFMFPFPLGEETSMFPIYLVSVSFLYVALAGVP